MKPDKVTHTCNPNVAMVGWEGECLESHGLPAFMIDTALNKILH